MDKTELLEIFNNLPARENEFRLDQPLQQQIKEEKPAVMSSVEDYQELLSHLILLALDTPSQHVH